MNVSRIFAGAAVRRLAYVLVALVLAWLGVGRAHAGTFTVYADDGAAYAACMAQDGVKGGGTGAYAYTYHCTGTPRSVDLGGGQGPGFCFDAHATYDSNGNPVDSNAYCYKAGNTCSDRSAEFGWQQGSVQPDLVCHEGCTYEGAIEVGGPNSGRYGFSPTGAVCTISDAPAPVPDADGDGVPDDEDAFPNDPGESTDGDGDGIGDNGDNAPDDPDNGADNGTGNESDNTSTGGGNCATPPNSTGDGITSQIAFQAWKIRCAIENVTDGNKLRTTSGTGSGAGDGAGTATGDGTCMQQWTCPGGTVDCAILYEAHQARCQAAGLKSDLEGMGDDNFGEDSEADEAFGDSSDLASSSIDTQGFLGGGGTCPVQNIPELGELDLASAVCPGANVLAAYILILAWIHVAHILGRGVTGAS